MKLDEKLKERIDKYFNEISAEELYYILTEKYKFPENSDQTVSVNCDKYLRKEDNTSDFFICQQFFKKFLLFYKRMQIRPPPPSFTIFSRVSLSFIWASSDILYNLPCTESLRSTSNDLPNMFMSQTFCGSFL